MIDLVITATLRPELLKITLDSHIENLFGDYVNQMNLVMNIDYAGEVDPDKQNKKMQDIFRIIESYPFRSDNISISMIPHFGNAFFNCMKKTRSEFIFNLEEDWRLKIKLDFKRMIELMQEDKNLVHLRLSAFRSEKEVCKNWNKFLFWNGDYFEVKGDMRGTIGWAGHPSLNQGDFIRHCLHYINPNLNPEKQIKGRNIFLSEIINTSRFGCFHPQSTESAVEDIGRNWMVNNGWVKSGSKAFFTTWERV